MTFHNLLSNKGEQLNLRTELARERALKRERERVGEGERRRERKRGH